MTKLFLSTPCYGGLCLEQFAISILKLQIMLMKEGVQLYIDTTENESLVHRARNVSIGRFMQKSDADLFMFVDADVHFEPESVLRLIKSDHDVSVACYPKKFVDWNQVLVEYEFTSFRKATFGRAQTTGLLITHS